MNEDFIRAGSVFIEETLLIVEAVRLLPRLISG